MLALVKEMPSLSCLTARQLQFLLIYTIIPNQPLYFCAKRVLGRAQVNEPAVYNDLVAAHQCRGDCPRTSPAFVQQDMQACCLPCHSPPCPASGMPCWLPCTFAHPNRAAQVRCIDVFAAFDIAMVLCNHHPNRCHRRVAVVTKAAASAGEVNQGPTTLERIAETLTIMFPIWVGCRGGGDAMRSDQRSA